MKTAKIVGLFFVICVFSLFIFLIRIESFDEFVQLNWTNQTPLPSFIASNPLVIHDNRLIVVGGASNGVYSEIFTSSLDSSGNVGAWSNYSSMPKPLLWHNVLNIGDYIYIFGGANYSGPEINSDNRVYRGLINSDGDIPNWEELTPLPKRLAKGSVAIVGDRIYYSGGGTWTNGGSPVENNLIYYAQLDVNGRINSTGWKQAEILPIGLIGHSMVYTGNKMVFIGGGPGDSGGSIDVFSYSINNDGTFSDRNILSPLIDPVSAAMVELYGSNILIFGGRYGSQMYGSYYYSPLDNNGDPSEWTLGGNLQNNICCAGSGIWKDMLYIVGGFGGAYLNTVWRGDLSVFPSPLPTSTPVPTPTSTPTENMIPIVLIPGIGASFNHEALMKGARVPNEQWEIATFIDVYDGLINSLRTAGYNKGENLFVYAYDWRQPIQENAKELERFVKGTVLKDSPFTKINIIGHSMGGLIARRYAQITENKNVDKLIIVGSPQLGAVKTYKIWEGADFSDFPLWQSALIRLYLTTQDKINKPYVQKVRELVPSLQDLLPTFNYLKDSSDKVISSDSLRWQNPFLYLMNRTSDLDLRDNWKAVIGTDLPTLSKLKTGSRSDLDKWFGLWEDGKPISDGDETESGDGTVLLNSAFLTDIEPIYLPNTEHSELVTKPLSQLKILKLLGIESLGVSVTNRQYQKAVIVAAGSPIDFQVYLNNTSWPAEDGIVYIDEPQGGLYQIKTNSTGHGKFSLYVGRLDNENNRESWEVIDSDTNKTSGLYTFEVNFNSDDLGANYVQKIITQLKALNNQVLSSSRTRAEKSNLNARIYSLITTVEKWSREKMDDVKYYENKALLLLKSLQGLSLRPDEISSVNVIKGYLELGYLNRN